MCPFLCLAFLLVTAQSGGQVPTAQAPVPADHQRCLNCHGQRRITTLSPQERLSMVAWTTADPPPERLCADTLFVGPEVLRDSVHHDVKCTACHQGSQTLPHPARLPKAQCAGCHPEAAAEVKRSRHAEVALQSEPPPPRCADCHGTHDIRPKSDPNSKIHPLEVIRTCGSCHQKHIGEVAGAESGQELVQYYLDSVHGQSVTKDGRVVGATCADCHGYHEVLPAHDPRSRVHRSRIPETCGNCHGGVAALFSKTVHAEVAWKADSERHPPVCSDCHTSHQITRAQTPQFVHDIVNECGSCHEEMYRTYRESYHGQVERLGGTRVARCSDCHGSHNIRRPDDAQSTLSAANRARTCGHCHAEIEMLPPHVQANFIAFEPHADRRDRARNPRLFLAWGGLIAIMAALLVFWGLHSLAWLVRETIRRLGKGPSPAVRVTAPRRFSAWQYGTHLLLLLSVVGLTLTGMPLKFSDQPWSAALVHLLGGPERSELLHRLLATLLGACLVIELVRLVSVARRRGQKPWGWLWGPNTLLPNRRDWREFKQMLRWFAGRGPEPQFEGWAYWEKFDCWAILAASLMIGISGLVLWFPTFWARFLSGSWFNIASLVHGYQPLLAVAFIVLIHLFNNHLRRGKSLAVATAAMSSGVALGVFVLFSLIR